MERPLQNPWTPSLLIEDLWKQFRTSITDVLDKAVAEDKDYGATVRIDKNAVFRSLKASRDVFEKAFDCVGHVYCRYSEPQQPEEGELTECDKYNWGMLEYLLDFSFSCLPIPVAIGQDVAYQVPEGMQYELLLGVESEMGSPNEVARDFLKLLDTRSRVRVLIYRSRQQAASIGRMKDALNGVLRRHAFPPDADTCLIVGIPSYFQWKMAKEANQPHPYQLYTTDPAKHESLVPRNWATFAPLPE